MLTDTIYIVRCDFLKPIRCSDTYYNIATSMIALLDVGVTNFNDGLFFDSSAFSVDQMKDAFAIIFDVMKQPQHYKLMMGIQE